MEQLRERTRRAHLALEAQPSLKRLLSSRLTVDEYGQLLQAMLAFYRPLEAALIPATELLLERHPDPGYRYLPRAPLLADDCRALNRDSSGFPEASVELELDRSEARLLGVLYVIEGATQGGRLIARHLAHTLDVSDESGASFFNIHEREDSWGAFRGWLDAGLADEHRDGIDSVVEGADMTFSALHVHLDRWPPDEK